MSGIVIPDADRPEFLAIARAAGYAVAGRVYVRWARADGEVSSFVARDTGRGRRWLAFTWREAPAPWGVTAHRTKHLAMVDR